MALLLRTILPSSTPTQLSSSTKPQHHHVITTYFHNKNSSIIPKPFSSSFHSQIHLSITHITTKQPLHNSTLTFFSTSQQQIELSDQQQQQQQLSLTRLLAQNVPWTSTTEDIRSLFEKHGKVIDVELAMHNKNRNRGLAFVEMASPEEALAALNSLQSYEFEGRVINIKYANPKKEKTPPPVAQKPITFNLFVANLSYETRVKDLKELFDSGTSEVVSAEVIFHENPRRPAGYGFVSFKSKKEANEALAEFQGKNLNGRPIRVAPSRRFVQLAKESAESEDTSSELSVNEAQPDKAD